MRAVANAARLGEGAADDVHGRAPTREASGDRAADARARAGDDRQNPPESDERGGGEGGGSGESAFEGRRRRAGGWEARSDDAPSRSHSGTRSSGARRGRANAAESSLHSSAASHASSRARFPNPHMGSRRPAPIAPSARGKTKTDAASRRGVVVRSEENVSYFGDGRFRETGGARVRAVKHAAVLSSVDYSHSTSSAYTLTRPPPAPRLWNPRRNPPRRVL